MSKKIEQHEILSVIKALAIDLGRPPIAAELEPHGITRHTINRFGGMTTLVLAAGLEPYAGKHHPITTAVFERNIRDHLESYEDKRPIAKIEPYKRILFIGDLHFPFEHGKTLEKIYRFAEKEQPEIVVQVGDLNDCFSAGKFPRSLNVFTPKEESKLARQKGEELWKELQRATKNKSRYVQLTGNHDLRGLKRILEAWPEGEEWAEEMFSRAMTFEGVETILDQRDELRLPGDVLAIHGHNTRQGAHRDYAMHNVVIGHSHRGFVDFRQIRDRVLWELNVGYCADPNSKGLSYTSQKINNWTLGWGWLDEYGPRFISA